MAIEKVGDLTPAVLEEILQRSLANPAIRVTHVQEPAGLGGINDSYASDLSKIVVTVEEDGKPNKKLHLVAKGALQTGGLAWGSVLLGLYIFLRETFWFDTALPELVKLISAEQAAALMEFNPKVHYAHCNYQKDDRQGCILSRALCCCCCVLMCKSKEKGVILMENLKENDGNEDTFVDLKEIERTSGGGVKTSHMRMILEAMAHFHGAWNVWLRSGDGMGDMSRAQMMKFFGQKKAYKWKWMWKLTIKRCMNYYSTLAEHKNMQSTKEKIQAFINSPASVTNFMKAFEYEDSKFGTMTHSDLWTSQIMFSLDEDRNPKRVKILDYQGLTLGHPAYDIWSIVYSATDGKYRSDHLEEDLQAYYAIFSSYMDIKVDFTEFHQEVEERRSIGQVMYGISCFATLSPTPLPSPVKETSKFGVACRAILTAEDTPEDHPDTREIRRRMMSNLVEMEQRNLI